MDKSSLLYSENTTKLMRAVTDICRARESHYPMIQFLIISIISLSTKGSPSRNQCCNFLHGKQRATESQVNKEFKKRQRLRQRQRQKAVILLVKRTKMMVLHVRHAFLNLSLPYSPKLLLEMTNFKVLTTTWTNYSKSFSLTLYFKSVRTNPVIGHVAHIL